MKIKACRTAANPGREYFAARESIPDDPVDMAPGPSLPESDVTNVTFIRQTRGNADDMTVQARSNSQFLHNQRPGRPDPARWRAPWRRISRAGRSFEGDERRA